MNKYEKALNDLKNSEIKLYVYTNQDEIDEKNQPTILDFYHHELFILQELVERATPKKVIRQTLTQDFSVRNITFKKGTNILSKCPCCNEFIHPLWNKKYCGNCGQNLDWSNENE